MQLSSTLLLFVVTKKNRYRAFMRYRFRIMRAKSPLLEENIFTKIDFPKPSFRQIPLKTSYYKKILSRDYLLQISTLSPAFKYQSTSKYCTSGKYLTNAQLRTLFMSLCCHCVHTVHTLTYRALPINLRNTRPSRHPRANSSLRLGAQETEQTKPSQSVTPQQRETQDCLSFDTDCLHFPQSISRCLY